ncbi:MAG TPA: helix-turn-helix domain-containing protein [Mycobacterium sp.]|nr:helix-turn-helix domain-containing protein [Mycobacterium sp.]
MADQPVRLSALGSDPASTLRIVSYFDQLNDSAADTDTILRSAALLAQCPIGARWASGTAVRYNVTGRADTADDVKRPEPADAEPAVWLERAGAEQPLDPVLIDRVRYALQRAAARGGVTPWIGDPALLEVVLSGKEHRTDRARAVRLLGLDESRQVRVLAVSAHSPPGALKIIAGELPDQLVRSAAIGNTTAVLCQSSCETRALSDRLDKAIAAAFPTPRAVGSDRGPWVGIGARTNVFTAFDSWKQAQRALRFASSTGYGRRAIAYERLSSLELLADLPVDRVWRLPEVARIDEIATSPAGALEVATMEAYLVFDSLRRTAAELHIHHSTVATRLAHVQSQMGWDFDDPMDRFMATLVLMVRRIALSSAELADSDEPVEHPTVVGWPHQFNRQPSDDHRPSVS